MAKVASPSETKLDTGTLYFAQYETSNFTFTALDTSVSKVKELIRKGWKEHSKQYNLRDADFTMDDVNVYPIRLGQCLRNDHIIYPHK